MGGLCTGLTVLGSTVISGTGTNCWSVEATAEGNDAARSTSAATMRPCGPDPARPEEARPAAMRSIDVPDSFASFRAKGEEKSLPAAAVVVELGEIGALFCSCEAEEELSGVGARWAEDVAGREEGSAAGDGTDAALTLAAAVDIVW